MSQIIGYRKFKSKKGADCCILKVLCPVSPFESQYGHVGNVVKDVFVPEQQHDIVTEKVIGHEVIVNRDFGGYLESIEIK